MSYIDSCAIPTVYCGTKTTLPPRIPNQEYYYTRNGTPYECMKKGIGIGIYSLKNKDIGPTSLRKIKFVGEKYEENFKKIGITSIIELMDYDTDSKILENILTKVFTKKNGQVDVKAYNSTLMFMYKANVKNLPACKRLM